MGYNDRVCGKTEITEPAILELMECPTIQRLKKIDQAGYFTPFYPGTKMSRFEHSVGDCLLLGKYGAPVEEQIAGLIHDASHAAFSHCVDYVLDAGSQSEQNHQDNVFDEFVRRSEIPAILKKHGFGLEYILDDANFPLKENQLPDICSDRIDYSLRMALVFKEIGSPEYYLKNLFVENKKWIFKNYTSARSFARLFCRLNKKYLSGLKSAVMFKGVGDYLRHALEKGYIAEGDLYSTDDEVLAKIAKFHGKDEKLDLLFNRMNNKVGFKNDSDGLGSRIVCKSRVVDPLFAATAGLRRISEIDEEWKKILETESRPKEYFIKFEK